MPFRSRNIAREMVAALAVMAVYVLVLLAPMHQAAGLQRDLAQLGYAALDGWSICSSLAPQSEDGKAPVVVKCAAAGIGKNEVAAIQPAAIVIAIARTVTDVQYFHLPRSNVSNSYGSSIQPRAPPQA